MRTQVILLLALCCVSTYAALGGTILSVTLSDGRIVKVGTRNTGVDCGVEEQSKAGAVVTADKSFIVATGALCTPQYAVADDDDNIWVAVRTTAVWATPLTTGIAAALPAATGNAVVVLSKTTGSTFGTILWGTHLNAAVAAGTGIDDTPITGLQYCEVEDKVLVKVTVPTGKLGVATTGTMAAAAYTDATLVPGTVYYQITPNGASSSVYKASVTAPSCTASAGRLIISSMLLVILALFI